MAKKDETPKGAEEPKKDETPKGAAPIRMACPEQQYAVIDEKIYDAGRKGGEIEVADAKHVKILQSWGWRVLEK